MQVADRQQAVAKLGRHVIAAMLTVGSRVSTFSRVVAQKRRYIKTSVRRCQQKKASPTARSAVWFGSEGAGCSVQSKPLGGAERLVIADSLPCQWR